MADVVSDTSPLQYLHQLGLLHVLPALVRPVIVPAAVARELEVGRRLGHNLPDPSMLDWVSVRRPFGGSLVLPQGLGPGESEVLRLAAEIPGSIALLDDGPARRAAAALGIPLRGTLGVLLDAKRAGLVSALRPVIARLEGLGFRLAQRTLEAVLELAGEGP